MKEKLENIFKMPTLEDIPKLLSYRLVKDDENYLWEEKQYEGDSKPRYEIYVGGYNSNTEFPHVPTKTILNL